MRDYQFGEFIYKLRTEKKLSQTKLGELVGVSNKAVSKWENGVSKPSMDTLKKLSEVFELSIEELLAGRRNTDDYECTDLQEEASPENRNDTDEDTDDHAPNDPDNNLKQDDHIEEQEAHSQSIAISKRNSKKTVILSILITALITGLAFTAVFIAYNHTNPKKAPLPETGDQTEETITETEPVTLEDVTEDTFEATIEESFEEISTESLEVTSEATPEVTSDETLAETSEETSEENSEETSEETAEETEEATDEIPDLKQIKQSVVMIETDLGTGSGFCAINEGWIITNYHVIEGARCIYVIDDNNQRSEITGVVLYDEKNDIAILETKGKLPLLSFGDGNTVNLMDEITVIGSPQGVLNTVSVGIVSNTSYEDYIVISAPISPGSSGGVMLNDKFQVIGVITATADNEYAQNLNFAINIEKLKEIHRNYRRGEFKTFAYPPFKLPNSAPNNSPTDNTHGDIPYYSNTPEFSAFRAPKHLSSEGVFRFEFGVGNAQKQTVKEDAVIQITITNSIGEVVYNKRRLVDKSEFTLLNSLSSDLYAATVDLRISEITAGGSGFGKFAAELIYKNKVVDRVTYDIEKGLPTVDAPFEALEFSGNGVGSVSGIDLPWGTYNVIFTFSGAQPFEVELNGKALYRSRGGNGTHIYRVTPEEDSDNDGTPLKNAVFNITCSDGPWTLTIERVNMSTDDKEYTDGQTYSGSGIGHAANIYLPSGTYYLTLTHQGSSTFEVELNGTSILRKSGRISYVYTLAVHEDTKYSEGTMPAAYFNVIEADGDWTITIHKVE